MTETAANLNYERKTKPREKGSRAGR